MKKAIMLILLIGLVLVVSGCSQTNSNDILSAVKNPENYINKSFTFVGMPSSTFGDTRVVGANYTSLAAKDEEGKPYYISLKYEKFYCNKCEITGTMKKEVLCRCQKGICIEAARNLISEQTTKQCVSYDWVDYMDVIYMGVMKSSDCQNLSQPDNFTPTRCKPDSVTNIYYIDVTKVKSLD